MVVTGRNRCLLVDQDEFVEYGMSLDLELEVM